jgi:hypothetical protein
MFDRKDDPVGMFQAIGLVAIFLTIALCVVPTLMRARMDVPQAALDAQANLRGQ